MKTEAALFYIVLLCIVCCSIIWGIGIFNLNQYLISILVGCFTFLMYYVLQYIGKLLIRCADYLLDVLCKMFEWLMPIVKNVYYCILGIIYVIIGLGLVALLLYISGWIFGDCSGHADLDHVHFEKY